MQGLDSPVGMRVRRAGERARRTIGDVELEILEESAAKSGHGDVLSERGVSERASVDALGRPSKRESDYEKRTMLSEREECGVRRRVRGCRAAASLNQPMQPTGFADG